jgi:hypothetical protein
MSNTAEQLDYTLADIEQLTSDYARLRADLAALVGELHDGIAQLKRRAMPAISHAAAEAGSAGNALREALTAAPHLFARPRTRVIAGIKIGYQKQRGQVVIDDEAATIRRMREQFPPEQCELLIRIRESVHKPAVYDLTAGDLKRVSIRIEDDSDTVVIRPIDSDIDRIVDALLAEAVGVEETA